MEDLNNLIDATTFGTVRRYLKAAHSPITTVMLVQHRNTLVRAGTALIEDEGSSRVFRRRQWAEWFNTGEVRVGGPSAAGIPVALTVAPPAEPPTLAITRSGANLVISWPAEATGFTLESAPALPASSWTALPGVTGNSVTITPAATASFYRLRQ